MPPGSGKSFYASVKGPAYYLGRLPDNNIITASYGEDLANSFGRKVRNIVDSKEYKTLFDVSLSEDSRAKGEWETNKGGSYFAAGVGTGITGRRGDLGLIDDPVKGRAEADSERARNATWDWYKSDFLTRLKPGGAQIIIQTRWHESDLAGRILPPKWHGESGEVMGFDGQPWRVICLPAQAGVNDPLGRQSGEWLWPEWFTEDYWIETRRAQQSEDIRNWNSLYQQTPTTDEGTFFRRDWFKRYRIGDEPKRLSKYGASDYAVTANAGDYTEHGIAGFDELEDLWILDWWTGQKTPDIWIDEQIGLAKTHKPFCWTAEGGTIRRSIEPFLLKRLRELKTYFRVEWLASNKDKPANARAFQALSAQGKVWIPRCEWGDQLIDQLISFPAGKHDDKVDVCGLFGRLLDQTYGPRAVKSEDRTKRDAYHDTDEVEETWKTV